MATPQKCYGGVRILNAPSPANVRRLDQGIMGMVRRMEYNGILLDSARMAALDKRLEQEQLEIEVQIDQLRVANGLKDYQYVNLNSGPQLAELLFKEFGLPTEGLKILPKAGRPKLDKKALSKLKSVHEIVGLYLQWKERATIRSNFCQKLINGADTDGRVRGQILTTRTATGRLAMKERKEAGRRSGANLMNIPTRSDIGKEIRKCFYARPGYVLASVDMSQIELRVVADNAPDHTMVEQFLSGVDLHTATASKVFRVPLNRVDADKHRKPAKNMNFGVVYGITGQGLLEQFLVSGATEWDLYSCDKLINDWFEVYHGIRDFMRLTERRLKAHGYVWDMFGRVRTFPEIHSAHEQVREAAVREAGNHPIQAGAQGLMKLAMAEIWDTLEDTKLLGDVEPLIQVHDELLFEARPSVLPDLICLVQAIFEGCARLAVPIESSAKYGEVWGSLGD